MKQSLTQDDVSARVRFDVRRRKIDIEVEGGSAAQAEHRCRVLAGRFESETGSVATFIPGRGVTPPIVPSFDNPEFKRLLEDAAQQRALGEAKRAWSTIPETDVTCCRAIIEIIHCTRTGYAVEKDILKELAGPKYAMTRSRAFLNLRINRLRNTNLIVRASRDFLKLTSLGEQLYLDWNPKKSSRHRRK